jgi:NAD(P)-dependent dehydrogenase (short-subunit alcohol dehydrogenase family)
MTLRFDGRVALITGAGNGLGKEYAKLFASLGAKVVVNDLGGSLLGAGASSSAADMVVSEIRAAGGEAVANYDSVTDGEKIVDTAIQAFGRIDIIVNNAGILRDVSFKKMSDKDWDLVYEVHSKGPYKVTRAAWPHMLENKYGRIVNISSPAGLYGNFGQANYSAMKRAAIGFTLTLSKEGASSNIKANVIAPIAASRMMGTVMPEKILQQVPPLPVATFVAYLCHESCPASGEIFELAGRWISRLRWERSAGVVMPDDFTVDQVAEQFAEICDMSKDTDHPPEHGPTSTEKAIAATGGKGKFKLGDRPPSKL